MPVASRKLPTPQGAAAARRMLLDGLARGADILELVSELASRHPPSNTLPGEVFLRLAAGALEWCVPSREEPPAREGSRRGPPQVLISRAAEPQLGAGLG